MKLVVVESPAKARTLEKYLGKGYKVLASYGHVRDLKEKEGSVEVDNAFKPAWEPTERGQKQVDAIAKALDKADTLLLATDPDREGEAISWHLTEMLREGGHLGDKPLHRVVFHEITKKAVNEAIEHPRAILQDLVDAYLARRALDYLVGFNLSPLLWKKVWYGLSAGRVQSPALRLIVEREQEIERFEKREYWTLDGRCEKDKQGFGARLTRLAGAKVEQFSLTNEKDAHAARQTILAAANGKLTVASVERKQRKRSPAPPFTTSTLQQEAARKLGFTARRTMQVAQQLYEGIDVGEGAIGLITYMRTDSVNLAQEAIAEIRDFIGKTWGRNALPASPRLYKTRSKNAQEAHEAVRPTSVLRRPEDIKRHLSAEQFRLYELVWKRAVACQMQHAVYDTVGADLHAGSDQHVLRATGSTLREAGFLAVYEEGVDDTTSDDGENRVLPPLTEGENITLLDIDADQHFTEPPPRYSEATLVRALEEFGIGRPSTYASIIQTLQTRKYAELQQKRFHPTEVGRVVNCLLTRHFTRYVDYDFTAKLEDQLDAVSRGERNWVALMGDFWSPFKHLVDEKIKDIQRGDCIDREISEPCPKCGKPLTVKASTRYKKFFIGCTGYEKDGGGCDYTRNLSSEGEEAEGSEPVVVEGRQCPKCGAPLVQRRGKFGPFIGCSAYPKCKHIEPREPPKDSGVTCPQCGKGTLMQRRSRYGKVFFSCGTYPECQYAVWNPPIAGPCPQCHWPILTVKETKRRGTEHVCPQKECGYVLGVSPPAAKAAEETDEPATEARPTRRRKTG